MNQEMKLLSRRRKRGRRRGHEESSTRSSSLSLWMATVSIILLCSPLEWTSTTTSAFNQAPNLSFHRSGAGIPNHQCFMASTFGSQGLSPYFQAILSRTNDRQRFVTGKYPLIVTMEENPTQKWLNLGRRGTNDATSTSLSMLVNDTKLDKSLASYDRFQWMDDEEREFLHERYATVSMELLAEIHMVKPGYLQVLSSDGAGSSAAAVRNADTTTTRWNRFGGKNDGLYQEFEELQLKEGPDDRDQLCYRDRLWVTGFSLAGRKGIVKSMDVRTGQIESANARSEAMTLWPNEVNSVPSELIPKLVSKDSQPQSSSSSSSFKVEDALLVSDGFLVPGKDRGGIYIVKNPGNPNSEWTVCLTDLLEGDRWFYHRTVWVDLTGDGRQSILTARAKLRKVPSKTSNKNSDLESSRPKNGQLVWLEMPKPHHFEEASGTPLEEDGTTFDPFSARHLPWKERVLASGPDVMFNVADLDTDDDTIEVMASQFFDKKVTLHSIKRGPKPRVTFSRTIDDRCGAAFGSILADLDGNNSPSNRVVVDSGSTVPTVKPGDYFSHLLVTSHECNYVESTNGKSDSNIEMTDTKTHHAPHHNGHSEPPVDGGSLFAYRVPEGKDAWKTKAWTRTTVATGFKVKGQLWNVINPGAPGFVYTFHAQKDDGGRIGKRPMIAIAGDCAESAYIFRPEERNEYQGRPVADSRTQYKLMCEIKTGATVGSIGIGYEDLCSAKQESGYAKIYIPCYEKDKILVFALGSGDDAEEYEDLGW